MGNVWSKKWKQLLVWFSGYFGFTAFAIVGGYTILKGEEELKKMAKQVFIVTLIFAALSAFFSLYNQFLGLVDVTSSDAYKFSNVCNQLISIARIVVYAVYMIKVFAQKDAPKAEEKKDEENN